MEASDQKKDNKTSTTGKGLKNKKKQKLINTWQDEKVRSRIVEIESLLESGTASKSRRRQLYSKIVRLRKALKGECVIGGQLEPTSVSKKAIDKKRNNSSPVVTRWKVCLCCRGKGHTMSECRKNPAKKTNKDSNEHKALGSKVESCCFNCGEKGHSLWTCSKPKSEDGELPFATCFQCGQQGHLISNCQENPSGVYPEGGGCHECSSPYHLIKDCPSKVQRTEQSVSTGQSARQHEVIDKTEEGLRNDDDNDSYWT